MTIEKSIVYTFNDEKCCVCETTAGVKLQRMRTMYCTDLPEDDPDNPNNCWACDYCMEHEINPYWDERWAEYYGGLM